MITKGLNWFESMLGILTMTILGLTAITIMWEYFVVVAELELLLAALTIGYCFMARSRWRALDWMLCRSDTPVRHAS